MTGHSIHAIGRWIVNLTAQPNFPSGSGVITGIAQITQLAASFFRGCDATLERLTGSKPGIVHPERLEDVLLGKLVERHAADAMHYFTQGNKTNVAVNKTAAWLVAQWFLSQALNGFVIAGPTFAQVEVRSIAGAMCQQLLDRDPFPALSFYFRNIE